MKKERKSMKHFDVSSPKEGAKRILYLISKLMIIRCETYDELCRLKEYALCLQSGDISGACAAYHAMAGTLAAADVPRATGNMLKDTLIWRVASGENPCAAAAAAGKLTQPLSIALKNDLSVLGELSELDGSILIGMARGCQRDTQLKLRYARDDISAKSSALWSGASAKSVPSQPIAQESAERLIPDDATWCPIEYDGAVWQEGFAAGEALEAIWENLSEDTAWENYTEDILSFYALFGTGCFVRDRVFTVTDEGFEPIEEIKRYCPISYYDDERSRLIDGVIDFMRGDKRRHIQIYGPEGMGKTALVMGMAEDIPELRIVCLERNAAALAAKTINTLAAQPLRFLLLFDNIDTNNELERELGVCFDRGIADNILFCSTSRHRCFEERFPVGIGLAYPKSQEFMGIVSELIESNGMESERTWVKNACIDHQVDAHDRLTMTAAVRIAEDFAERRI